MTWVKPFSCPELGCHKAQHSVGVPFRTQLSSRTSASGLQIGLSVKEVPKTTFLYNYTFWFYFQDTLLLMFYMRGCSDAASPGASLDAHPHAPGCMKISCAFPSIYTKQAIVKRKGEFFQDMGNPHIYHTGTQNLSLWVKLLALQNPFEALSSCCSTLDR